MRLSVVCVLFALALSFIIDIIVSDNIVGEINAVYYWIGCYLHWCFPCGVIGFTVLLLVVLLWLLIVLVLLLVLVCVLPLLLLLMLVIGVLCTLYCVLCVIVIIAVVVCCLH